MREVNLKYASTFVSQFEKTNRKNHNPKSVKKTREIIKLCMLGPLTAE